MKTYLPKDKTDSTKSPAELLGTILWIGSLFIGFLLFVSFILPALESQGYANTICNVTKTALAYSQNKPSCNCPISFDRGVSKCVIYYPCLQIFASYVDSLKGISQQGLVVKCRRHVGEKCSYRIPDYECSTEKAVYKMLKKMKENYGEPGTTFSCFYKADQHGYVVLTSDRLIKKHILHIVLWPCLGALIGLILMRYSNKVKSIQYCGYQQNLSKDTEDLLPLFSSMDT